MEEWRETKPQHLLLPLHGCLTTTYSTKNRNPALWGQPGSMACRLQDDLPCPCMVTARTPNQPLREATMTSQEENSRKGPALTSFHNPLLSAKASNSPVHMTHLVPVWACFPGSPALAFGFKLPSLRHLASSCNDCTFLLSLQEPCSSAGVISALCV